MEITNGRWLLLHTLQNNVEEINFIVYSHNKGNGFLLFYFIWRESLVGTSLCTYYDSIAGLLEKMNSYMEAVYGCQFIFIKLISARVHVCKSDDNYVQYVKSF